MSAIPEPSRRRLAVLTAAALGVATLLFVAVVLPAEYGRDPLGFGRATGLVRLAASGRSAGRSPIGGARRRRPPQKRAAA